MFDAFFILLRETAELFLCAEALRQCLREREAAEHSSSIKRGVILGFAFAAVLVASASAAPVDPRLVAAATVLFGAAMMCFAVGMLASARSIRAGIGSALERWTARLRTPTAVVLIMAFATTRETIEVAVFLQRAWSESGASDAIAGALLGLVASMLLWRAYRSVGTRAGLLVAFRLSALMLAFVSADLIVGGLEMLARAEWTIAPQSPLIALLVEHADSDAPRGWIYAILMLGPVTVFLRDWWNETARS